MSKPSKPTSAKKGKSATPEGSDYEIGFGKPPKATQFKSGQSGNPKGRTKGSMSALTTVQRALNEKIWISEKGRRRQVSKFEAAIMQVANKAASGDARAIRLVVDMVPLLDLVVETPASAQQVAARDKQIMQQLAKRFRNTAPESLKADERQTNNGEAES